MSISQFIKYLYRGGVFLVTYSTSIHSQFHPPGLGIIGGGRFVNNGEYKPFAVVVSGFQLQLGSLWGALCAALTVSPSNLWVGFLPSLVEELFQTATLTILMWDVFVAGYGDVTVFDRTGWSSWVAPALSGVVSMVVQLFFAWRIWSVKRTPIAATVAISIGLGSAGIAITVLYTFDPLPAHLYRLNTAVQVWLIGSCVCDVLIAVAMVILLIQARKHSAFRKTETLLNRLIANSIESGTITAVLAILELAFYTAFPQNFLHVMMMYVRGRVYANVLLAALNGRKRIVQARASDSELGATLYRANLDEGETMALGHKRRPVENLDHTPTQSITSSKGGESGATGGIQKAVNELECVGGPHNLQYFWVVIFRTGPQTPGGDWGEATQAK
ncbi:hypothetical protein BDZ94DRAFT_1232523 [Collybia nuda]|uniref:DUF6534 domain-containing protein n=1 Tax=Collybia nuda TaxID=64659 RepID=A0A9P6CN81_9AGAR|nr:hypothetical protein BDZ94DRAFT_1232523 [Collybia nuda]